MVYLCPDAVEELVAEEIPSRKMLGGTECLSSLSSLSSRHDSRSGARCVRTRVSLTYVSPPTTPARDLRSVLCWDLPARVFTEVIRFSMGDTDHTTLSDLKTVAATGPSFDHDGRLGRGTLLPSSFLRYSCQSPTIHHPLSRLYLCPFQFGEAITLHISVPALVIS